MAALDPIATAQRDVRGYRHARVESPLLRIDLLGGFRLARDDLGTPTVGWQRRSAKQLTKLLATLPSHTVHREQVYETLWPRATIDSARNSLAKALNAARHVLEPGRAPRHSVYLKTLDEMIVLDSDFVRVDADEFQQRAQHALRGVSVSEHESARVLYTGALLPEDRYEDWAAHRRRTLADLNLRLLMSLADLLEARRDRVGAIDCLIAAIDEDVTHEDAHRRLMRLYDASGARDLALRQYEFCRVHLQQELNRAPHPQTTALYDALLHPELRELTPNM